MHHDGGSHAVRVLGSIKSINGTRFGALWSTCFVLLKSASVLGTIVLTILIRLLAGKVLGDFV